AGTPRQPSYHETMPARPSGAPLLGDVIHPCRPLAVMSAGILRAGARPGSVTSPPFLTSAAPPRRSCGWLPALPRGTRSRPPVCWASPDKPGTPRAASSAYPSPAAPRALTTTRIEAAGARHPVHQAVAEAADVPAQALVRHVRVLTGYNAVGPAQA